VHLLIAIRDGIDPETKDANISQQWMPLKVIKESHPAEVAEYAVAHGIDDTPAFRWWVYHVLRRRDQIIASVRARITKTTHKYGIEIPKSKAEAIQLDIKNGNKLWQDALEKEMSNISVAFDILSDGERPPPG